MDKRNAVQVGQHERTRHDAVQPRDVFRGIVLLLHTAPHPLTQHVPQYHTGFRHQVHSWPDNPVSHYIASLSSRPAGTVVVDLGCGDAALAKALVPRGLVVLSYDLVSDGEWVVDADVCGRVPLPGSEGREGSGSEEGQEGVSAQVVDVVVCALSLMSTNWVGTVREAWRVLKLKCVVPYILPCGSLTSPRDFFFLEEN